VIEAAFLVSEAVPYAKTGGLADVAGALPKYLAHRGADVRLFMPLYREVRKKGLPLTKALDGVRIPMGGRELVFSLWEHCADGFRVYFIENDEAFIGRALRAGGDYPDNGKRFGFFIKPLESEAAGFRARRPPRPRWQSAAARAVEVSICVGPVLCRNESSSRSTISLISGSSTRPFSGAWTFPIPFST
jgi:hypothetical protein